VADTEFDQFSASLDLMRMQLHSLRGELADALEHRDPLTGVRNRANMLADLREQQALVARGVLPCSIAILDLDHFKQINDRHGHQTGDVVLESVAGCLDAKVRPYDRIYRYGGEEFLLCMPSTTLDGAVELAERLREAIASHDPGAAPDGQPLRLTASFGVTAMARDRKVEESIDRADKALYQAKAAGRNRVVSGG
jgi:diguanylate cyclase (GGDEF)-like protein